MPRSIALINRLPLAWFSWLTGLLSEIDRPPILSTLLVKVGSRLLGVNQAEMSEPLERYRSLSALFTRELKAGLRPIGQGFVSPIDGTLRSISPVVEGQTIQVKNINYSVSKLLGDHPNSSIFEGGCAWTFYLAPHNYHHVHAPIGGTITEVEHLPGQLWPVNSWAVNNVAQLFPQNERVVVWLESEIGKVALVLVGAFNVGRISVAFDQSFRIAKNHRTSSGRKCYTNPIGVEKGAKIGTFSLGSTVVVLTPREGLTVTPALLAALPQLVKYGEALA